MNNELVLKNKSPFPFSSILFFAYVIIYSVLICIDYLPYFFDILLDFDKPTFVRELFSFCQPVMYELSYIISALMLAVLPLFKLRKHLIFPFMILIFSCVHSAIRNSANLISYYSEGYFSFLDYFNSYENIISAIPEILALILMIVAAIMSSKKRGPFIPIIAGVWFFSEFATLAVKRLLSVFLVSNYIMQIAWIVLEFFYIIGMILLAFWISHGKTPKVRRTT